MRGVAVLLLVAVVLVPPDVGAAHADVVRAHNDTGATGWYPDAGSLSTVAVPNGSFGQLFSAAVDGQVYAQPLVSNGTLLVATERDNAYGLNPETGAKKWGPVNFGTPWNASDLGCADLAPTVGVTSTPVVDAASNTEYLTAKTYASGSSGPAAYSMHALDVTTGAERPGFPVVIGGAAQNAPGVQFDATHELQRPGLLLMNGVVYAAFGGHCDFMPYQGWIFGISTTGQVTSRWTDAPSGQGGAGIWQSGGALISDRSGDILFTSGNGYRELTVATPGNQPPGDLGESIVRLHVQPDGSLRATDFFAPYDAPTLDLHDADFGSGGPVALPESYNGAPLFGTAQHPHLMVEEGKSGYVYLVDRDDLGGYREGANGGDAVLARLGPFGGVWSTPAVWPGDDGGYIYVLHGGSPTPPIGPGALRAYRYGLDGSGNPTLVPVARTTDEFGFGSGTPVVTSDGATPGSALVWIVWQADVSGANAELRAYDAVPQLDGTLHLRWSAPIGTASKFTTPAVNNNRVYVGTRDGHVIAFGSPVDLPFTAIPARLDFPKTVVSQSATKTITLRANDAATVTALSSNSGAFTVSNISRALPAALGPGDSLTADVTFSPAARGEVSGALTATLSNEPSFAVGMEGAGQLASGDLAVFPDQLSLGGAPVGGAPVSTTVAFSNRGAAPLTVTASSVPPANSFISVSGLPAVNAVLAPGQSVIATVTFTPKTFGLFAGTIVLSTNASPSPPATASVTIPVSATAAHPAHLTVSPLTTYFGAVRIGRSAGTNVTIRNDGDTVMTITKSKPPALGVGFTAAPPFAEGSIIPPGRTYTVPVTFTATKAGHFVDTWIVNGDDDSGLHTLTFDAYGSPASSAYWMFDPAGRVYALGDAGKFAPPRSSVQTVALAPSPSGQGIYVLDERGRVATAGDAVPLGSLVANALGPFERASAMSVTPSNRGYWIFTSLGRVFAFGDARRFGDLAGERLHGAIIASVATPTGRGYYMVGSDGGVFTFGDAKFFGSTGSLLLAKPVVGLVPTASGRGYWLAAADGGVFSFGDAPYRGSMGGKRLRAPVCGMVRFGNGYLMVANDGGIFDFSNVVFVGSLATKQLPAPIIGVGAFAA